MRNLLFEGSRDNLLLPYLSLIQKKNPQVTLSQLKQTLLAKFVNEANIRSLSMGSNFYLAGVARYYFNGDLTASKRLNILIPRYSDKFNQEICERLDALIKILRNSYIDSVGTKWEQPEDFGTLSIDKLLKKYSKKINQELGIIETPQSQEQKEEIDTSNSASADYTFDIMYSHEDCKKYHRLTEPGAWCITYAQQHYNGYTKRQNGHFVIFLRNGYENVPRKRGANFPLDEYGLSMLAVLQSNSSPKILQVTTRYNHGARDVGDVSNADHALNEEEFLSVIGADQTLLERVFKIWQANNKNNENGTDRKALNAKKKNAIRTFKYAQMMINSGQNPQDFLQQAYPLIKFDRTKGYPKFNKTICSVSIDVDGTQYYTISDRGKLLYDYVCIEGGGYRSLNYLIFSQATGGRTYLTEGYPDLAFCELRDKVFALYDLKRHKFITVEGQFRFRELRMRGSYENENFFQVMTSLTQRALIDMSNYEPVQLPNGSYWFENINEFGDTRGHYNDAHDQIRKDTKLAELVYDSAANESYVFDLVRKQFVGINGVENGDLSGLKPDTSFDVEGYISFYKGANSNWNVQFRKLFNVSTNSFTEINGVDTFSTLKYGGDGVIIYAPAAQYSSDSAEYESNKRIVANQTKAFDMVLGKDISFNGEPIYVYSAYQNTAAKEHHTVIITTPSMRIGTYIYDALHRRLYINKETGDCLFKYYGDGNYTRGPQVYSSNGDKYSLMWPDQLAESIENKRKIVVENFLSNLLHKSRLL